MKNNMSLYSILRSSLRRLVAFGLVMVMMMGFIPGLRMEVNDEGEISVEKEESPFIPVAKAAEGDPLQSVASVTTGGSVASYVDINSNYELPEGGSYTTLQTGTKGYVGTPGTYFSYHTDTNGSTTNSWVVTTTSDLSWGIINGDKAGVTGTVASTANADYNGRSGCETSNGALCTKVNSQVIQIKALADISISFTYSSKMTIGTRKGDGSIQEGVYTLKTTSASPTISQIMNANNVRSSTSVDKGSEASATGTVTESLQGGEYLYLYFFGFANDYNATSVNSTTYNYTASVTNFQITPVTQSYSMTVGNIDCAENPVGGGTITVNGVDTAIPAAGTAAAVESALSGTSMSLSVKNVPTGYVHIGWKMGEKEIFEKTIDISLAADTTVYALLIPEVTVTMGDSGYSDATYAYKDPSGATVNEADQYIARNSAATAYYKTLADAFSANPVVVLLGNIVLNGNFTVPSGKTLSLQHDWGDPATSTLQTTGDTTGVSIFAKATINGTVTLAGDLVASAAQSSTDGINGRAAGGVGQFIVNGTVNVESGGNLCAYGMVTGPGKINVASGGTVYELMEMRDMRSIYALMDIIGEGAFPLNHYFVKTNEVTTIYKMGAKLLGCYFVGVSGVKNSGEAAVIGEYNSDTNKQSMFMIKSGSLTKSFSSAAPYNNKIIFRAENGSDIQSGRFSISMSIKLGSVTTPYTIDTSQYDLPLSYAYGMEVLDGGKLTINSNVKLLPGALLDVQEGGTLTIASGKKLVLYRANDYGFTAMSGFSSIAYPGSFTKPSGLQYATNTAADTGSAKLIVNGTLNVDGGLYVTDQLTDKTEYANGYNYLTGTGTVNINGSLEEGVIGEWTQAGGSQSIEEATVKYVPIKGLPVDATEDNPDLYSSLTSDTYYGVQKGDFYVWATNRMQFFDTDNEGNEVLKYVAASSSASSKVSDGLIVDGNGTVTTALGNPVTTGKVAVGWKTEGGTTAESAATIADKTFNSYGDDVKLYAVYAVAQIGTEPYETLAEAVSKYSEGYIQMLEGVDEAIVFTKDVLLDTNGKNVTITVGDGSTGTIYGADTNTNGYGLGENPKSAGTLTISGTDVTVAPVSYVNERNYVRNTVSSNDTSATYSFHRFEITPIGYQFYYNPNGTHPSHLAFQAVIQGDDTARGLVKDVGFRIDASEVPADGKNAYTDNWYLVDVNSTKTETDAKITLSKPANEKLITFVAVEFEDAENFDVIYTVTAKADFDGSYQNAVILSDQPDEDNTHQISFDAALKEYYNELTKLESEGTELDSAKLNAKEIIGKYLGIGG